jgi:hypothetical protein
VTGKMVTKQSWLNKVLVERKCIALDLKENCLSDDDHITQSEIPYCPQKLESENPRVLEF